MGALSATGYSDVDGGASIVPAVCRTMPPRDVDLIYLVANGVRSLTIDPLPMTPLAHVCMNPR